MIVPLDALSEDTIRNIAEAFVLREGTDYGEQEMAFADKVEQVLLSLRSGEAVLYYSELHDSVDIKPRDEARHGDEADREQ
ncbi:YheU family protein [Alteromonas sp. ASW11-19]|uniref:YheU family protein n=1 Tax=Alteromonas salexigens TaxID=2982530 RepID=A0ABT2VK37_9ALTE|nr:YheU family protein [Alteromonas salexigens]MCU7553519.1 YheU family protein [Alteromonas salexigens]